MKKFKIGLLGKIIVAIIAGISIGMISPDWIIRIFLTINGIFSQFLGFAIPLIILGLVTTAIADIGKGAGKMLLLIWEVISLIRHDRLANKVCRA